MARILTVDDEPDVQFLLKVTLELAGHTVDQAPHGAAALEMLKDIHPDLVVTDLMMPVMDGKELIRRIREAPELAGIPILLLTAAPDVAAPADRIMRKPFIQAELMSSINDLISGAA